MVKTRLSPPLSPEAAAAVYEASLGAVSTLAARERGRVEICYDAGDSARGAEEWFAEHFPLVPLCAQSSGDLGLWIARDKWGEQARFQRINSDDPLVRTAADLLQRSPTPQGLLANGERFAAAHPAPRDTRTAANEEQHP